MISISLNESDIDIRNQQRFAEFLEYGRLPIIEKKESPPRYWILFGKIISSFAKHDVGFDF